MKVSEVWNRVLDRLHVVNGRKPETMNEYLSSRLLDSWSFVCFLRNGMVVRFGTASTHLHTDAVVLEEITSIVMPTGKKLEYPKSRVKGHPERERSDYDKTLEDSLEWNLFTGNRGMVVRLSEIVAICEGDS